MTNALYPIFLHRMQGVRVVVIGGGAVGERKIAGLLAVAAAVRLVSPQATPTLQRLAAQGVIEWLARSYQTADLAGCTLAFAATNQRAVNHQIGEDAAALHILCNVADAPEEGDFHIPALHRHEKFTVAVGSRGSDVQAVRRMRDQIAQIMQDEGSLYLLARFNRDR